MAGPWKGPWSVKGLKLQLYGPHGESASGLEEGPRGGLGTTAFTKALPPAQQTDEALEDTPSSCHASCCYQTLPAVGPSLTVFLSFTMVSEEAEPI